MGRLQVIFTESCDPDVPRLITNIETTPAAATDDNMIEGVYQSLKSRNLLPSDHMADKGIYRRQGACGQQTRV
jgi:hypothetical protein